jgi:putative transcriptional regulator
MQKPIQNGSVLIAEPFMWDINFHRSVVVVTDHHDEGTHGFILNKPLEMKVNDLLFEFPAFEANVYYGGPMAHDRLDFLHNVGDLLSDSIKVSDGVWWGGDYNELVFLAENELITPKNLRFFLGYTGWSPNQLQEELDDKAWIMAKGSSNYIFNPRTPNLWREVLHHQNSRLAIIGDMPDDYFWN